ncbi:hypothetical protein CHF27_002445 [Romboutsia maritimum]|uniref:Uncharacterized protein n=1 Tax=Romboutsia maritimum TaxID=2020948 RepID=A0A371IVN5_9FIRM|nr:hypothetical protein [Romboutsia maritimum]RDY24519.1 hypothetical protein CHF27_002445 [Romboutsia maritimum]
MRFNKKCRILELIKMIEDGLDYIKNKFTQDYENMFKDCIDALSYISNIVKNEEGISEFIKSIILEINNILTSECDNKMVKFSINSN